MSLKHADDKSDTIVVNSWKINSFATGNIQLCCRIFETATTIIMHRTIIKHTTIIKQSAEEIFHQDFLVTLNK